jgi:hypothetical protein
MEFSRCARAELAPREKRRLTPVSQNSTAKRLDVEVDVDLGEPDLGRRHVVETTCSIDEPGSHQR